ncbi:hypothetical protein NQ318_000010 [Aromia moschata]|uniref:C2H2-type domain-containing protein n=1 Tax=Aromia moschata TaxID=1265417 RepID=A0AAV8YAK3_9CUCU|nr:hypothetical protein NQ318_000010 [Aromia moschata]
MGGDTEPSEDPSKIQHDHNETYPEDPRGIIGSNFSVKVEEALGEDSKNARTQEILYECKECGFRTKHKYSCRRHLITHRNIPGMQTSRCEFCPFTTRRRQTLTEHMALHADPAQVKAPESKTPSVSDDLEVTLYSCKDCPFKTKFKQNLSWHKLTHKYQQEGRPHSCTECNFQTKYERCLKAHMKRKHSS